MRQHPRAGARKTRLFRGSRSEGCPLPAREAATLLPGSIPPCRLLLTRVIVRIFAMLRRGTIPRPPTRELWRRAIEHTTRPEPDAPRRYRVPRQVCPCLIEGNANGLRLRARRSTALAPPWAGSRREDAIGPACRSN